MQRIKSESGTGNSFYGYRFYGFYSKTGAYELRNFEAGEPVDEATIKRFGISKEFLEPKKSKAEFQKTPAKK